MRVIPSHKKKEEPVVSAPAENSIIKEIRKLADMLVSKMSFQQGGNSQESIDGLREALALHAEHAAKTGQVFMSFADYVKQQKGQPIVINVPEPPPAWKHINLKFTRGNDNRISEADLRRVE